MSNTIQEVIEAGINAEPVKGRVEIDYALIVNSSEDANEVMQIVCNDNPDYNFSTFIEFNRAYVYWSKNARPRDNQTGDI